MSELLRGILDQACVDSRPAFYTLMLQQVNTVAARTFQEQQATLQCKTDTYFLVMAYAMFFTSSPAAAAGSPNPYTAQAVKLFDTTANEEFSNLKLSPGVLNGPLNNCYSLNEYILFQPRQLITARMDVVLTDPGGAATGNNFLTLSGVEYRMGS